MAMSVGSSRRTSHRGGGGGGMGGPPGGGRPPHLSVSGMGASLDKGKISDDRSLRSNEPLIGSNHVLDNDKKSQLRVQLRGSQSSTTVTVAEGATVSAAAGGGGYKTFRCCLVCECNCFVAYLALGMIGFVLFWSVLMLRIYLPERYWQWSYIWR